MRKAEGGRREDADCVSWRKMEEGGRRKGTDEEGGVRRMGGRMREAEVCGRKNGEG